MRISDWSSDVCSSDLEGRVSDIRRDVQLFKRKHGLEQGKDYSELNDDQLTDDYHYTIFPNVSMNVHADDVMMFRQRPHPTNPDKMFYDVWLFELVPDGEEWPERPNHKRFKHGEKPIGQVLDQRSEARRVGKEWFRTVRYRGSPDPKKKN